MILFYGITLTECDEKFAKAACEYTQILSAPFNKKSLVGTQINNDLTFTNAHGDIIPYCIIEFSYT